MRYGSKRSSRSLQTLAVSPSIQTGDGKTHEMTRKRRKKQFLLLLNIYRLKRTQNNEWWKKTIDGRRSRWLQQQQPFRDHPTAPGRWEHPRMKNGNERGESAWNIASDWNRKRERESEERRRKESEKGGSNRGAVWILTKSEFQIFLIASADGPSRNTKNLPIIFPF